MNTIAIDRHIFCFNHWERWHFGDSCLITWCLLGHWIAFPPWVQRISPIKPFKRHWDNHWVSMIGFLANTKYQNKATNRHTDCVWLSESVPEAQVIRSRWANTLTCHRQRPCSRDGRYTSASMTLWLRFTQEFLLDDRYESISRLRLVTSFLLQSLISQLIN